MSDLLPQVKEKESPVSSVRKLRRWAGFRRFEDVNLDSLIILGFLKPIRWWLNMTMAAERAVSWGRHLKRAREHLNKLKETRERQWFSTCAPVLQFLGFSWPPVMKLFLLLLHSCNFDTVMNQNVNNFGNKLWPRLSTSGLEDHQ